MRRSSWATRVEDIAVIVALAVVANLVWRATGWHLLYVLLGVVGGGTVVHMLIRARYPRRTDSATSPRHESDSAAQARD